MGDITSTYYVDISLKNTEWKARRTIFPHRCIFTGQWIKPFEIAVRGKHEYIIVNHYWTTSNELIIQKLRGNA